MTRGFAVFLFAVCSCSPLPTSVTYTLGGVVSGPYRVSADLGSGVAAEAKPPPGRHGDGAELNALTMPITVSRSLAAQDVRNIQRLAGAVSGNGPASPPKECPPTMTADAIGRFDIVQGGATHTFLFPTPCMTPAAGDLLSSLVCGADPDGRNCASRRKGDGGGSPAAP
jgi:hypothetical protein